MKKIAIVLALVVVAVIAVYVLPAWVSEHSSETENEATIFETLDNSTIVIPDTFDDNPSDVTTESSQNYSSETSEDDVYIVTFYGPDDSILLISEVEPYGIAIPPEKPHMPSGYVFTHWDTDFSYVTADMSVHAVCEYVGDQENVLALSGGYVQQGENVVLSLKLCGDVCICAFDIRLIFDQDNLDFVGFQAQDGAVDANCVEETGTIYLNFVSMENTVGEVDLVDLIFKASGDPGQTKVSIDVVEMIAYDADYNFRESVHTVVPGTIIIAAP